MTPLSKIEEFFDNYNFNDQEIQLSPCEKILNLEKFIKSHIKFLKNNKGKKLFMPYYIRLEKTYLKLKK